MPKVSEDHRERRREQIALAAMRCFARKGFEGTSMADIIAESELSAGAIYLHYTNKNDLVAHVVGDVLRARNADLVRLVALDPLPHPADVMRTFVNGLSAVPGGANMVVQVWAIAAREPSLAELILDFVTELRGLYEQFLVRWFRQAGWAEEPAVRRAAEFSPVMIGICQGYILQSAVVPGFDAERYIETVRLLEFAALPAQESPAG